MVSRQLRFQEYPQCAQKYPKKVQFLERIVFQKNLNGHANFSCMRRNHATTHARVGGSEFFMGGYSK